MASHSLEEDPVGGTANGLEGAYLTHRLQKESKWVSTVQDILWFVAYPRANLEYNFNRFDTTIVQQPRDEICKVEYTMVTCVFAAGTHSCSEILQYVLCKRAYVSLHLNQPEMAYSIMEPLINQAWTVRSLSLLIYCYAAEALCLMDRLSEAVDLLGLFLVKVEENEKESPFVIDQVGK